MKCTHRPIMCPNWETQKSICGEVRQSCGKKSEHTGATCFLPPVPCQRVNCYFMSLLSGLCKAIKTRQKTHPKEPILLTAAWTRASLPEESLPTNSTCYAVLDDHVYIPLWTYCGPGHTLLTSSSFPLSTLGHVCTVELEVDVPNGLYIRLRSVAGLTAQSDVRLH
jgi:hypothetical protein